MRIQFGLIWGILLGWGLHLSAAPLYSVTEISTIPGTLVYNFGGSSINDVGQIAGVRVRGDQNVAAIYSGGQYQYLGTLSGGISSSASGINNAGQVTGTSCWSVYCSDSYAHAFLYTNGQMQDLGTLGGSNSFGYGINNAGQVVGNAQTSAGYTHAFLYSNGQMTDIGDFLARAINDAGQVTGSNGQHAVLYSNGQLQDLGTLPSSTYSQGNSINNVGQVTGYATTVGGAYHAFLYTNGQMQDLNSFLGGSIFSEGLGINDAGQVIGSYETTIGSAGYAFVYQNGQAYNLNDLIDPALHLTLSNALAINNRGQIVAAGYPNSPVYSVFLLTPVPEPSSWALLGLTLLGWGGWACRRSRRIGNSVCSAESECLTVQ